MLGRGVRLARGLATAGVRQVVVDRGARPLQGALHRLLGGVEHLGHLGRAVAEHVAQHQLVAIDTATSAARSAGRSRPGCARRTPESPGARPPRPAGNPGCGSSAPATRESAPRPDRGTRRGRRRRPCRSGPTSPYVLAFLGSAGQDRRPVRKLTPPAPGKRAVWRVLPTHRPASTPGGSGRTSVQHDRTLAGSVIRGL